MHVIFTKILCSYIYTIRLELPNLPTGVHLAVQIFLNNALITTPFVFRHFLKIIVFYRLVIACVLLIQ